MPDAAGAVSPAFRLRLGEAGVDGDPPSDPTREEDREALRLMVDAARAEPHDPDYYHILGEALLRAGRVEDAIQMSREAVAREPLNAEYRLGLGRALWRARRTGAPPDRGRGAVPRRSPAPQAGRLEHPPDDPRLGPRHRPLGRRRAPVPAHGHAGHSPLHRDPGDEGPRFYFGSGYGF